MPQSSELLKKTGYGAIIWLSCIDEPRNKTQITREWGLSLSAKTLHREDIKNTFDALINEKLLKEVGDGKFESIFDGLPEVLKQRASILEEIEQKEENTRGSIRRQLTVDLSQIPEINVPDKLHYIITKPSKILFKFANYPHFIDFLNHKAIKNGLLNMDRIKTLYGFGIDEKDARRQIMSDPLLSFIVMGYAYQLVSNMHDKSDTSQQIRLLLEGQPLFTYLSYCISLFELYLLRQNLDKSDDLFITHLKEIFKSRAISPKP
ncbi:MAG: hypothetical protein ABIF85_06125 [Nanoarchaeota archaeon]